MGYIINNITNDVYLSLFPKRRSYHEERPNFDKTKLNKIATIKIPYPRIK